ncbi:MAG TPA: ABC transporter substrate-binding protein [Actinotalea sp.]|nr:ABC transporter substrate-binding protein [Actinotalea sp.]
MRRGAARPGARRRALGALAVLALTATACAPTPEPTAATTASVEVFSWWASGSEKLALDTLVGVFGRQYPQTRYVDAAVAGGAGSAAKDVLDSRLSHDDPPDTFQVHGGAELADHVSAGALTDLDALFTELGLDRSLTPEVLDQVSIDGTPYAVPSNVHRANVLWANAEVLAAAGIEPGDGYTTLDEWMADLETVAGTGTTPLAVAATWTQVHLLEQVLLARLGADGYRGLWDGGTDPGSPQVTSALGDFDRLIGWTNADRDALDWQDAAQRVTDGSAAFTVMGDWALPVLEGDGVPATWWPVPGTEGTFDLVVDAFTLPVGAASPDTAEQWLRTVASYDAQASFANAKGALPARADISTSDLGTYQRRALFAFRSDEVVPSLAHGSAIPPDALTALTSAVGTFTRGGSSVAELQAALVDAVG